MTAERDLARHLACLAEAAGRLVLEVYARPFAVTEKGPNDPVTEADLRANALLVEALTKEYPGAAIVAEESDPETFDHAAPGREAFFVDPLDGTRDFVLKNGEFVVMIGRTVGGRAQTGAVHAPALGRTWMGVVGEGAWERTERGEIPVTVRERSFAEARLVVSRSRRAPSLERLLANHPPSLVRPLGSAGLKACAVVSGDADAYVQLERAGCFWDSAAPEAIVRGAGGVLVDQDGEALDYTRKSVQLTNGLLAGSPELVAEIVRHVRA